MTLLLSLSHKTIKAFHHKWF